MLYEVITRNKERMAMIEKGADPTLFKTKAPNTMFFTLKAGLHTRPAATVVKMAAKYKCDFFISRNNFV